MVDAPEFTLLGLHASAETRVGAIRLNVAVLEEPLSVAVSKEPSPDNGITVAVGALVKPNPLKTRVMLETCPLLFVFASAYAEPHGVS